MRALRHLVQGFFLLLTTANVVTGGAQPLRSRLVWKCGHRARAL
jgi:hypothetical protein